jgi:tetratricopeptide (TPR) repeat protein
MRLLSSDLSGKPSFTQFKGTPPPYAILSHTWEDDQEVSYIDARNGLWEEKKTWGRRKIEFCASRAKQDNLEYFWVDTCCIDIWNHPERSKAINSMFRWYQNAAKCYVILSDVSVPDPADIGRQSVWKSSFMGSRWFTRGWTLQELIAPASVEFFSFECHLLGDKRSLGHLICEITGIPAKVLQNGILDNISVPDRREWAKNRVTKEPEDKIYCLLGILNVFMMPSYSEGIDNATKRLDDELERINNKTQFIVPYARNDNFTGYESELAELENMVLAGPQSTKIAITGPGGIGKSQLALELAYRTQQNYQNCSVFWISASDMDSFYQGCSYIAQKVNIPGWNEENEDTRKLLQLYLSGESAGRWLLIYDDADDASLGDSGQMSSGGTTLLDFIPQSDQGCIVFTTAISNTAEILTPGNTIRLQKMAEKTAEQILQNLLTNSSLANEREEVRLLLEELSYLPLAITQAAAYIKHNEMSISDYLELISEQKEKIMAPNDRKYGQQLQHYNADNPVAMTTLVALAHVSSRNPTAANCLFFMACVDRKDILQELLPTTSSKATVDLLSTYAVVIKRPASSALDLHRLVHLALRSYLQEQVLLRQCNQEAIEILLEKFPSDDHENRSKWRRLLPHAKFALADDLAEQKSDSTTNLAWKCALALYKDGRFDEAEKLGVRVVETRKTKPGINHPDTLKSMINLASIYRILGRLEEAEKLAMQVIATHNAKHEADNPDILMAMNNLASTYRKQGRYKEASKLFAEVLKSRKSKLGDDHTDTLISMGELATMFWKQGRLEEAEKLALDVMETRTTKLGADHPSTLTSMNNLASIYVDQHRYKESEKLLVQVIETQKTTLGPDHPFLLMNQANLAATYLRQGRLEEADKLSLHVLEIRKIKLGADHPDTLMNMNNLASIYKSQSRYKEAEKLLVQAMEAQKTKLGTDHPETLISINNVALVYAEQGQFRKAEGLYKELIQASQAKLGADHPDTLRNQHNFAHMFYKQGRWEEVKKLLLPVVESRKVKLGLTHPATLGSMNTLALTFYKQGKWEEAENVFAQLLEGRRAKFGPNHPVTLATIENLRITRENRGLV